MRADQRALTIAIVGRGNGSATVVVRSTIPLTVVDRLVDITVRASNHNVVVVAPLAIVHSVGCSDWATPEHALDQRCGVGLLAGAPRWRRIERG